MSANFEAKKEIVSQIKERFEKAQSVVVVHFSGITVEEVTKLRNQFRDEMEIKGLQEHLTGPNAYAFGMKDAVAPAKVIYDFIEKNKKDKANLSVKGGLLGREVMDEKGLENLSKIPSREVLLARLVGSINSSVANLVYGLEAIRKKQAGEE